MKIKQYDRVLLSDGNEATIVEIFEEDTLFLADIDKDGDTYTEDVSINEIEQIIRSDNFVDGTVYIKPSALLKIEKMRKGKNIKCSKCDKGVISAEGDPETTKVFRCNECKTAMILTVHYNKILSKNNEVK